MDRLTLHIEYLLLRHDCVVVPGCGAFINVYHSALENPETGVMSPMTCEVRFNPALSHDDGMLATSFARRERVSFAEGREMVRSSISNLRDALSMDGEVTIGRLGKLRMDTELNISFQPMTTPERATATLGFGEVRTRIIQPAVEETTEMAQIENPVRSTPKNFDTTRNYYIPINKMFARMAASFLIVAVVALAAIIPFGRDLHEDQASVIPVKAISQAVSKAASSGPVAEHVYEPEVTQESVQEVPSASDQWHIIVGAFYTQKDADLFISMNSDKGYRLTVLPSRNLYRISACSAQDKGPLVQELKSQALRSAFPEAWIFNSRY